MLEEEEKNDIKRQTVQELIRARNNSDTEDEDDVLKHKMTKKEEEITKEEIHNGLETEEENDERIQSSQEMNLTKDVKKLEIEEDDGKIPGSVDTFTPRC